MTRRNVDVHSEKNCINGIPEFSCSFTSDSKLKTDYYEKNSFCFDLLCSSFPRSGFFEYFHDEFLKYIRQEPLPNKRIMEKPERKKSATLKILKRKERRDRCNWVTPDIADYIALLCRHRYALSGRTYQRRVKNNGATEAKYKFPFCISLAMRS